MGLFDKDILDRLETKFSRTVNSAGGKASNFLYSTFVAPVENKIKQMEQKIHKLLGINPLKAKPEEVRATLADLHRSMFYMNTAYQPSKSKDEVSNDKFSDLRKKFDTAAKHLETNNPESQKSFGEYCVAAWQFEVERHNANAAYAEKMAKENPKQATAWRQYAEFSKANAADAGKHLLANEKMLNKTKLYNPTYDDLSQYQKTTQDSGRSSVYEQENHYDEPKYVITNPPVNHQPSPSINKENSIYVTMGDNQKPEPTYSKVKKNQDKQNDTQPKTESRPGSVYDDGPTVNIPPPPTKASPLPERRYNVENIRELLTSQQPQGQTQKQTPDPTPGIPNSAKAKHSL